MRDRIDILLIKKAYEKKIPILGICKGAQIINVALGGTLYQNIVRDKKDAFDHNIRKGSRADFTHNATLEKNSLLYKIFKRKTIKVNGGHQQAVKTLPSSLISIAKAEDNIIEAFEGKNNPFLLGIQFHAELQSFDSKYFKIFSEFIKSCSK
jgi:putative glutamine amidotransferase